MSISNPKPSENIPFFQLDAKCSITRARATTLNLPSGPTKTPAFIPAAPQGSVKGLTTHQLHGAGVSIYSVSAHHLAKQPGAEVLQAVGGASGLMGWDGGVFSDSGGFQAVSLHEDAQVIDEGIRYTDPDTGESQVLTPESSIAFQRSIGAEIILALDDMTGAAASSHEEVTTAANRTIYYLDRTLAAHAAHASTQLLFAPIQGGASLPLRRTTSASTASRSPAGFSIAGLTGFASKHDLPAVLAACTDVLPEDRPRHALGLGFPVDILVAIALGVDVFDSAYPTRAARFGTALTSTGNLNLRHGSFAEDFQPIEQGCGCDCCRPRGVKGGLGITRAYLHHLAGKETAGGHMVSLHNVRFLMELMRRAREAVLEGRFEGFLREALGKLYGTEIPDWALEALRGVGVELHS